MACQGEQLRVLRVQVPVNPSNGHARVGYRATSVGSIGLNAGFIQNPKVDAGESGPAIIV
jgi:hypothetical protein|tara:strand:+ start:380 stop:559 length:180 start_codon:yes stop_codon:yes gene_type:complete